jgi:thiamine-phosphate pyrophosphorylase
VLLYYITDRLQFPGDEASRRQRLLEKIADAARSGVDFIQLREKDLPARELEDLARAAVQAIRDACQSRSQSQMPVSRLLINSRTDIALASGADGVHLRAQDVAVSDARDVAHSVLSRLRKAPSWLVAASCHTNEEVSRAAAADFIVFAPVFEKQGIPKSNAAGLDTLQRVCRQSIPVIALGGITQENALSCIQAGAAGLAGIRLFQDHDIFTLVPQLRALAR